MGCEQLATKADIEAINNRLNSIENKLNNLATKNELKEIIDSLNQTIREIANLIDSLFAKILAKIDLIEKIINNLITSIKEEVITAINALVEIIKALFEAGGEKIDYGKIESYHKQTRQEIIKFINDRFNVIKDLFAKIDQAINGLKAYIASLLSGVISSILAAIAAAVASIIAAITAEIAAAVATILAALTALKGLEKLIGLLQALLGRLLQEKVDYGKIEGFHVKTRQVILNYISGVLTSYIKQLQTKLDYIISLLGKIKCNIDYDKIKCEINYSKILQYHLETRNVILVGTKNYIDDLYSKVLRILTSILNAINKLDFKVDYEIILRYHQKTRADIINYIKSLLPFVDYDKINKIDYDKIKAFHEETRKNLRDYVTFEWNNRMSLLNTLFNQSFNKLNDILGRLGFVLQYLLQILDKLSGQSTIKIASCTIEEGTETDVLDITSKTTGNILQGISLLSDQMSNLQLEICRERKEVFVGVVSSEKEILHITGNKLVLHFVTLDNYPRRKSKSTYTPIELPAPREDYDWLTAFENLRKESGNQYAGLKLEGWKTPITGFFANKNAANAYFDYLINYILDPTVVEEDRFYPEHTNPRTAIITQTWRPYRAFLMSVGSNGQAECLLQWHPQMTPSNP